MPYNLYRPVVHTCSNWWYWCDRTLLPSSNDIGRDCTLLPPSNDIGRNRTLLPYPPPLLEWYCLWSYPPSPLDWYCSWSYPPPLLDYYCCCNRIPGEALGVLIGPLEARKKYHKSEWPCYIVSSIRNSRWWWSVVISSVMSFSNFLRFSVWADLTRCHFPTFCAFLFELTWQG